MSEEIKRTELNEAQLENVSGGFELPFNAAYDDAKNVCQSCHMCKKASDLARHLQKLYPDKIKRREDCPFYQQFQAALGGIK